MGKTKATPNDVAAAALGGAKTDDTDGKPAEQTTAQQQSSKPEDKGDKSKDDVVTMSQADLDALISKRLERERAKHAEDAEKLTEGQEAIKRVNELQQQLEAEKLERTRASVAATTGVPAALITGDDEAAMTASAEAIVEYASGSAKPSTGPVVPSAGTGDNAAASHGWDDDAMSLITGE
ncbi:hypothetical protein PQI66_00320 [Corynebacterium sp. USCH3]|uniref:hypothetical protein n=1 Tax=Corynebacterium sp. USCH3 TaxID=3024840 RepID=UPI003099F623